MQWVRAESVCLNCMQKVQRPYSLVMKLMNSDTHSCTVSFASFAIFAFEGRAFFMILLMLAMGRNLSCSRTLTPLSSRSSPASRAPLEPILTSAATKGHKTASHLTSCLSPSPRSSKANEIAAWPGPFRQVCYIAHGPGRSLRNNFQVIQLVQSGREPGTKGPRPQEFHRAHETQQG